MNTIKHRVELELIVIEWWAVHVSHVETVVLLVQENIWEIGLKNIKRLKFLFQLSFDAKDKIILLNT